MIFISTEDAVQCHDASIEQYGGLSGINDYNALESALNSPRHHFSYGVTDIAALASVYMHHLIKNHPFLDGNKRTGWIVTELFIEMNEHTIEMTDDEIYDTTVKVADDTLKQPDLEKVLRSHIR